MQNVLAEELMTVRYSWLAKDCINISDETQKTLYVGMHIDQQQIHISSTWISILSFDN